jgi:hypothetical protein
MYPSLLALLAAAPLLAAPGSKRKEGELYYPVKDGAKRVMEMVTTGKFVGSAVVAVDTVTKVEAKGGKYRVTVERVTSDRETKEKPLVTVYEVADKGLARVTSGGKDLPEPVVMLKLPAKTGETWTRGDSATKTTLTTGKEEEVEVPAGKFRAIPVTAEFDRGGQPTKTTVWYAPEVGMVKTVTTAGGIDIAHVLKSFTPGK